jgi:polyisoprenoid-binding protein YceI
MRTTLAIALVLLSLGPTPIAAQQAQPAPAGSPSIELKAGKVWIEGTSTLHDYTAATTTFTVRGTTAAIGDQESLLEPNAIRELFVEIPVISLTSKEDGLNKNLYKALDASKYPVIAFRLREYSPVPAEAGVWTIRAAGTLWIAGVERETEMVLDVRASEDALHVSGSRDLLMTDFGIKPPKLMMGMLKTDNRVVVRFEIVLSLRQDS